MRGTESQNRKVKFEIMFVWTEPYLQNNLLELKNVFETIIQDEVVYRDLLEKNRNKPEKKKIQIEVYGKLGNL